MCNNNFQETLNILKINCAKNILNIKFHILFGMTNFSLHLKEIRLMHAMVIGLPTKDQTWEMLQEIFRIHISKKAYNRIRQLSMPYEDHCEMI